MASIRDVAQRAGVGVGTVSRVLNGNDYVAEDTRKKIEMAINELDYTPNELARNLFRNKTGIIGVMVLPMEAIMLPLYIEMSQLGWVNTLAALVVPFIAKCFSIYMFWKFFLIFRTILSRRRQSTDAVPSEPSSRSWFRSPRPYMLRYLSLTL